MLPLHCQPLGHVHPSLEARVIIGRYLLLVRLVQPTSSPGPLDVQPCTIVHLSASSWAQSWAVQ